MKRIYLDSNVFISAVKEEIDSECRGLYVEAQRFFEVVKGEKHILVLSELFFKEVFNASRFDKTNILNYFKSLEIVFEIFEGNSKLSPKDFLKRGLHFTDSMHAAIAVFHKCDCIVTFNIKDFEKVKDKIRVFEPNEF